MTPKEKAIELVWQYYNILEHTISDEYSKKDWDIAKQCALIAVSMVIQEVYNISHQRTAIYDEKLKYFRYEECKELKYWQEVKSELENL